MAPIRCSTALRAPLGAAMTRVTLEKLQWPIGDARYEMLNHGGA